ncbi:MAG TPA: hypothetical protein ENG22_03015 [Candidatus Bathyarchaeota archaeon]|nr:hypothetical protein [Candidatus Bathyarchaeota archaeon]
MSRFVVVPVGWGFMSIHENYSPSFTVITDGGAIGCCYSNAFNTVLRIFHRRHSPWIWILSHMDYDHFSIVANLVSDKGLPEPSAIILPASYSYSACKDTLIHYLALAEVIAYKLRIRRPRYTDIFKILSKCHNNIGVSSGTVFSAGKLEYLIVWPEDSYAKNKCRELLSGLRRKIEELCKDDPRCKEVAEEAIRRIRYEVNGLNVEVYKDHVDVSILKKARNSQKPTMLPHSMKAVGPRDSDGETSLEMLFEEAAKKLNDPELYELARNVQNIHSIGYTAMVHDFHSSICTHILSLDSLNCYSCSCGFNRLLLLYLADLEGNELNMAIKNYIKYTYPSSSVLMEIAPHHGNSYSRLLNVIKSCITYIPRCNIHVPCYWKRKCQYLQYLCSKAKAFSHIIVSNHSKLIEFNV